MKLTLRLLATGLLALLALFGVLGNRANAAYPAGSAAGPPGVAPRPLVPQTHGRLNQLSWRRVLGPTTAEFHAVSGIRRSYFIPPPNVGDTVLFAPIVFGDNTQTADSLFTVTYVNVAQDWFIAEKIATHTYASTGPWIASFSSCCRLSLPQHINNPDETFRAESRVDLNGTIASPVSSLPAIVDCPRNAFCSFIVPAIDPDNQPLHYRFATATEAGDPTFHQPGPPQAPHLAAIDPSSGVYTWDTNGAQVNASGETYYSTQVQIEDLDVNGVVVSKSPIDFFIRLVPVTTNVPPEFISPTPPDNTLFTVLVGDTLVVPVRAADPDPQDTVTLAAISLPAGASFPIPPPANIVSSTLTWAPSGAQVGSYIVNFTATDPSNASALTSIRINVVSNAPTDTPTATPPPVASTTPTNTPTPCTIQFTDVDFNNPFYAYIRCLACRGIISGYADGTFRPNNNVTRAQICKMVSNSAGYNEGINSTQQSFTDVPASAPFWIYVERLSRRGYINGYDCGGPGEPCDPQNHPYFRPNNAVTRGQLSKINANAAGFNDPISSEIQTFADVAYGSAFWLWVERVYLHGVITGYLCGGPGEPCDGRNRPYFRPYTTATRAQTAKIVANTFFPGCVTPARR